MKVWKVKVISWKILLSIPGRLISMKARHRYQVSVYRTNGPLVNSLTISDVCCYLGKQFGPRSGPTILIVFLKEFFWKINFEKNQQTTKRCEKLPSMQRVNGRLLYTEVDKNLSWASKQIKTKNDLCDYWLATVLKFWIYKLVALNYLESKRRADQTAFA